MPPSRRISDDTRIIDLTLGELVEVLVERLEERLSTNARATADREALIDTWEAARLLGIAPKRELGPEPKRGAPDWRIWRDQNQALRDDVAHRFQQLLLRRPALATLARYEGRRRYFVRAELLRYLESLTAPAQRRARRSLQRTS